MKRMWFIALLTAAVLNVVAVTPTQAGIIATFTKRTDFDAAFPAASFEGWDGFAVGTTFPDGTTISGITYNSSGPAAAIVDNNFVNTSPPHGLGDLANPFGTGGFFGATQTMTFSFATPITAFGIDINTFAVTAGAYTATTSEGDVVNSALDPFPTSITGHFVGFSATPFTSVTIAPTTGFTYTLDSMRFQVIPEPTSVVLFGMASLALACFCRRRSASVATS